MDMMRKTFSREFKITAVRLVADRGITVTQAARDLDVVESVLRRWMRELTAPQHRRRRFPGTGRCRPIWRRYQP